jgi:SPX domain protein involved in polyphosphate accumulation
MGKMSKSKEESGAPERMTPHLEKLIEEVEADITEYGLSPVFNSVEEFMASLKKD